MSDNSKLIADALQKTDPALYASIDGGDSWPVGLKKRGARVDKYRRYERGDHDAALNDQLRKIMRLKPDDAGSREFNDPYCKIIVDKMAGRNSVSEISTKDEAGQTWIEKILEINEFEVLSGEVFRGAIRDGDSYVIIDPITLMWAAEPPYDGFSGVVAIFDEMRRKTIWACKIWSEADNVDLAGDESTAKAGMKLVVYQAGQISWWKGTDGGAEAKPDDIPMDISVEGVTTGNAKVWPLEVLPIVHFVNQKDNYTSYGESEIRAAIPLQDLLNRTLHSMGMASELSAFKIYWSKGMEIKKDGIVAGAVLNLLPFGATPDPSSITEEGIRFLEAIEVGEFNESDISNYTNQIDTLVREISQVTQTPIYGVTAQGNLSGEALKQLEIGLIGKVKRFQRENNGAIRQLIMLTAEMSNEFTGHEKAPIIDTISINWKSPEIIDVGAQIAVLVAMKEKAPSLFADEWYREQIGGLLAMTQKQIREEGEKAQNAQSLFFGALTGADGNIPVA